MGPRFIKRQFSYLLLVTTVFILLPPLVPRGSGETGGGLGRGRSFPNRLPLLQPLLQHYCRPVVILRSVMLTTVLWLGLLNGLMLESFSGRLSRVYAPSRTAINIRRLPSESEGP